MEILISSTEAITCDLVDKDKSVWSCKRVDANGSVKEEIGNINDWVVGDGVMSEVVDVINFKKYKISGLNSGMKCIIDEKDGSRKMVINCKNY